MDWPASSWWRFTAPAAAIFIAGTAQRAGGPRAGWLSAVIYLSTPWIYRLAVIAYVEGPLCFYHAALVWAVFRGWSDRGMARGPLWGLIGLLAGGAMACKYPALISAVIPFGLLGLVECRRIRSFRPIMAYGLCWAVVMGPWLLKNVIDTGNPVYPLGYHVFGGRNWDDARETQWFRVHGPFWPALRDFGALLPGRGRPVRLAISPLHGLRPTCFPAPGFAKSGACLGRVCGLPVLDLVVPDPSPGPLLAPLAALPGRPGRPGGRLDQPPVLRNLPGRFSRFALLGNFVHCTTALTGLNEWTGNLALLRNRCPGRLNPPLAAIDRELPPNAKILLVGSAAVFHVNHTVLYNTVFTPETIEVLAAGENPCTVPPGAQRPGHQPHLR